MNDLNSCHCKRETDFRHNIAHCFPRDVSHEPIAGASHETVTVVSTDVTFLVSAVFSYTLLVTTDRDPRLEQAALRPDADPLAAANASSRRSASRWLAVGIGILLGLCFMGKGTARAAWQEIAQFLSLKGKPEPASASVLSEHEIEALDQMTPQKQAELLLERSVNHYHGANEEIE